MTTLGVIALGGLGGFVMEMAGTTGLDALIAPGVLLLVMVAGAVPVVLPLGLVAVLIVGVVVAVTVVLVRAVVAVAAPHSSSILPAMGALRSVIVSTLS